MLVSASAAVGGYQLFYKPRYLEGTVLKESGSVANVVGTTADSPHSPKNESERNLTYILTVDTSEGKYIISVDEVYSKPLILLEEAISVGSRVRFKTKGGGLADYYFSRDHLGRLSSLDIDVYVK